MFLTEDFEEDEMVFNTEVLDAEVAIYNQYMAKTGADGKFIKGQMTYKTLNVGWYELEIEGQALMEGDLYDMTERVKSINRENGLNHLGGMI